MEVIPPNPPVLQRRNADVLIRNEIHLPQPNIINVVVEFGPDVVLQFDPDGRMHQIVMEGRENNIQPNTKPDEPPVFQALPV